MKIDKINVMRVVFAGPYGSAFLTSKHINDNFNRFFSHNLII